MCSFLSICSDMFKRIVQYTESRYTIIGALCAILNNTILILSDTFGLHYWIGIFLTFVITVPLSYTLHTAWTFNAKLSCRSFGRYVLGTLSSVFIAACAVAFLRGGLGLAMIFSAPLATIIMFFYNYLMARWSITNGKITNSIFKR